LGAKETLETGFENLEEKDIPLSSGEDFSAGLPLKGTVIGAVPPTVLFKLLLTSLSKELQKFLRSDSFIKFTNFSKMFAIFSSSVAFLEALTVEEVLPRD